MRLIKILRDKVQIRTDQTEFLDIRINDLLAVGDDEAVLAALVTSLSDSDAALPAAGEEDYILPAESIKTIECAIIGSIEDGVFCKSIRRYPTTAIRAEYIRGAELAGLLGAASMGSFDIGMYEECSVPAYIEGNHFFQRHACIVGNTGSGKSETVAKILEETSKLPGANLILFDIHGEYGHFSYVDNIKFTSGDGGIDFPIWMFGFRDMAANILKIKEESATVVMAALRKCYAKICPEGNEGKPVYFDYQCLIAELAKLNTEEVPTGDVYKTGDRAGMYKMMKGELNGKLSGIINILEAKLRDKRYSFLFSQHGPEYLNWFVERVLAGDKPVKTIDLSDIPHDVAIPIIGAVTKLVYEIQKASGRRDRPLTLVCDEAHVYIPNNFQLSASEKRLVEIFENIAKEGRKFGVTLLVASQRPSELNKTIMAQCANFIVMKLNNEADKAMIKGMLPDGNESIVDETAMFAPGEAIIVGDASQMPLKIKVELAKERPMSRTIGFWDEWRTKREFNSAEAVKAYLQ